MNERAALTEAIRIANRSPCKKSQRGVVIWTHFSGPCWIGFNGPALGTCDGSEACRAACGMLCVHAEMSAILLAGRNCVGASMLHVKVVVGLPVASGDPSCYQCSKHILEAGISWMWLLHEGGLKRYSAEEFHRLSLAFHGLHPAESSHAAASLADLE